MEMVEINRRSNQDAPSRHLTSHLLTLSKVVVLLAYAVARSPLLLNRVIILPAAINPNWLAFTLQKN
jgi:hypothetical protein